MKIFIIDYDLEYLNQVTNYLIKYNYEVYALKKVKELEKFEIYNDDLILMNLKFKNKKRFNCKVIYLSESNIQDDITWPKYRELDELMFSIENMPHDEKNIDETANVKEKIKFLLIFNLDNNFDSLGTLIKFLMSQSKRTLLVDYKTISNIEKYVNFERKLPSIINYFHQEKLKKCVYSIDSKNVYTFYPSHNSNEMLNLPLKDKINSINELKNTDYELIVINTENKYDDELIELFRLTDTMILFYNDKYSKDILINSLRSLNDGNEILNKIYQISTSNKEKKIIESIKSICAGD